MKKNIIIIIFGILIFTNKIKSQDMVCFYMMNTEIKHTMEENPRQKELLSGSTQNNALELTNKNQFKKLRETTEKIKSRLSSLNLFIQSIPFGWNMTKFIQGSYEYQAKTWQEIQDAPPFVLAVIPDQISFAKQLEQNVLFVYGVVASYGVINEMESKDRRILLEFGQDEFEKLYLQSIGIYSKIRMAKQAFAWKKNMFFASIKEDKRMFDDILKQF